MEYVKICGIQQAENLKVCIKNGANAVGFVYNVLTSPRNLSKREIINLVKESNEKIKTVCVIKAKSLNDIIRIDKEINTDLIQVHSKLDFSELTQLPKDLKEKLIISKPLNHSLKEELIQYKKDFYAFLIDSSEGSGKKFNIPTMRSFLIDLKDIKIILAGGINQNNIKKILEELNPYGIDLSSSLETRKGVKNKKKIRKFLKIFNKIKKGLKDEI